MSDGDNERLQTAVRDLWLAGGAMYGLVKHYDDPPSVAAAQAWRDAVNEHLPAGRADTGASGRLLTESEASPSAGSTPAPSASRLRVLPTSEGSDA